MDPLQNPYMGLAGITPEELNFLQQANEQLTETQQKHFHTAYTGKRKSPQDILLFTIIGFFGFAGIQRFVMGQTAWGVFFFLTCGLGGILTIVDVINNKKITMDYNKEVAFKSFQVAKVIN